MEPEAADKLAGQQDELAKKIQELSAPDKPAVQAALEQAKREAEEAAGNLLEQKQPEALAHQDKAELALKAAAREGREISAPPSNPSLKPPRTSSVRNWQDKVDRLAAAAEKLEQAAKAEHEISKDSHDAADKQGLKPDEAAALDKKNDEATEKAKSAEDVTSTLPKADEAVKKAEEKMGDEAKDLNKAEQSKSRRP